MMMFIKGHPKTEGETDTLSPLKKKTTPRYRNVQSAGQGCLDASGHTARQHAGETREYFAHKHDAATSTATVRG